MVPTPDITSAPPPEPTEPPDPCAAVAAFLAAFPPETWEATASELILARSIPLSAVFGSVPVDRSGHTPAAMRLFRAAPALAAACRAVAEARDATAEAQAAITMAYCDQPCAAMFDRLQQASAATSIAAAMAREAALQAGAL